MSMWSRIGNLFPRKRGVVVLGAQTPSLPPASEQVAREPSVPLPAGALDRASGTSSVQQDAPAGIPHVDSKERMRDSSDAAVGREGATFDRWLAARQRPLVYAHKLRLHPEELEDAPELTQPARSPELRQDTTSHEAGFSEEPIYSSTLQAPPAERASLIASECSFSLPRNNGFAVNGPSGSQQTQPSEVAGEETLRPHIARFSMLRVVAQQWRPAVTRCRYLVVIGSTSEARKLAPLIRTLQIEHRSSDAVRICVAGSRPERIREALALLKVSADLELTFPMADVSIDKARTGIITGFGRLLVEIKPDWVLVQGDSMTVAMASIAAYYANVPVAHLDGGVAMQEFRAGDESNPEILHRQIATLFASVHFADTATSKELLVRNGVPEQHVLITGNPGVDALHETCTALGIHIGAASARASGVVHVLVIVEMPDTIKNGLPDLCSAIRNLARSVPGLYQFVWPVVGDTEGIKLVNDLLDHVPGVLLSGPAGYEQYLTLLNGCDLVLTDVEDVQEEAPSLGKPVLLMQSSVLRSEAQRNGITTLTGSDAASIQAGVRTLARKLSVRHGSITNPFGDGRATGRMVDFFEGREVLEFGRTALPRLLRSDEPSPSRLLAQSSR